MSDPSVPGVLPLFASLLGPLISSITLSALILAAESCASVRTRPTLGHPCRGTAGRWAWPGLSEMGTGLTGLLHGPLNQGRVRHHSGARWTLVYCHKWSLARSDFRRV